MAEVSHVTRCDLLVGLWQREPAPPSGECPICYPPTPHATSDAWHQAADALFDAFMRYALDNSSGRETWQALDAAAQEYAEVRVKAAGQS